MATKKKSCKQHTGIRLSDELKDEVKKIMPIITKADGRANSASMTECVERGLLLLIKKYEVKK